MALIIEVLEAGGVRLHSRVRADVLPLTIGRGWDNDVILEDAYVDARHARIRRDDNGNIVIEDLGSVNGLLVLRGGDGGGGGGDERCPSAIACSGVQVRIGRTVLRFRDPSEPVPPALPDVDVEAPASEPVPGRAMHPFMRRSWRMALPAAALAAVLLWDWLSGYEGDAASDLVWLAAGTGMLAALWAGAWAIAGRVLVGRFSFTAHLAAVSAAVLAVVVLGVVTDWLRFLTPADTVATMMSGAAYLLVIAALAALHLSLATSLAPRRCLRAGGSIAAVILAFGVVSAAVERDEFSDVPDFNGVLKPVVPRWPRPMEVADFTASLDALRDDADAMAATE